MTSLWIVSSLVHCYAQQESAEIDDFDADAGAQQRKRRQASLKDAFDADMAIERVRKQHSIMQQFMHNFARNMRYAVLADSKGDMPEDERLAMMRQIQEGPGHDRASLASDVPNPFSQTTADAEPISNHGLQVDDADMRPTPRYRLQLDETDVEPMPRHRRLAARRQGHANGARMLHQRFARHHRPRMLNAAPRHTRISLTSEQTSQPSAVDSVEKLQRSEGVDAANDAGAQDPSNFDKVGPALHDTGIAEPSSLQERSNAHRAAYILSHGTAVVLLWQFFH